MWTVPVDDAQDPRIGEFVGARDADLRRRGRSDHGVFLAEGDIVVDRALRAGYEIRSVLVDATRTRPLPFPLPDDVPVYGASAEVVLAITGMPRHRGCLAIFDRRPIPDPAGLVAGRRRILVVENLTNPTNLGIIGRSAAALGAEALLLDPTSCDPLYRRASRVSMGEMFALPWTRTGPLPDGLSVLTDAGFELLALTPDRAAEPIDEVVLAPEDRVALVLGAEGPGLSAATLARIDRPVRIPMHGGVDSLNVAAAAAIACFVLGRGRSDSAATRGRATDPAHGFGSD